MSKLNETVFSGRLPSVAGQTGEVFKNCTCCEIHLSVSTCRPSSFQSSSEYDFSVVFSFILLCQHPPIPSRTSCSFILYSLACNFHPPGLIPWASEFLSFSQRKECVLQ
ncbi:hypothetical protein H1C71_017305 [Ictidomys tridecemlineatus]|nr:hypothetical protein H1C71_017305 [Ictidomys tridecemlineatus]